MGDLRSRRIEALEQRQRERAPAPPAERTDEDEARRRWLFAAKARRSKATHSRAEVLARDLFRLLRRQGELDGMDIEGVRARMKRWWPPPDERAVDRVTARAAYDGEGVAEGLECPPEWAEAFEAAEELLARFLGADPEDLAWAYVAADDLAEEEGEAAANRLFTDMLERLGITRELHYWAVGPNAEGIPKEERQRRLEEALADFCYGERGWKVQQGIWRIDDREEQQP